MSSYAPFEFRFPSTVRPFLQCYSHPVNNSYQLIAYKPDTSGTYFHLLQNLSITNTSSYDVYCSLSYPMTSSGEQVQVVIRAGDTSQIVSSESPWHITGVGVLRARFTYRDSQGTDTSSSHIHTVASGLKFSEDEA